MQPMVDPERIGLWGSSYSGAHVMHLAAFDRRVKCVVAQVPLVNAMDNFRRLVRADQAPEIVHRVDQRHQIGRALNSSHSSISYAVFCLKKKTNDPADSA